MSVLLPTLSIAQSRLALEDAWKLALQHNHNVQITKVATEIAEINLTKGNAGMLPSIGVLGGVTAQQSDTRLDFAGDIPSVERNGVQNYALNASANVAYRIYGGGSAWYNLQRFDNQFKQAVNTQSIALEGTLIQVANVYYNLVLAQQNEALIMSLIEANSKRLVLSREANKLGSGTRLELLNAEVDLQADSIELINVQQNKLTLIHELNFLTGQDLKTFITAELPEPTLLQDDFSVYEQAAQGNGTAVVASLLSMQNAEIAKQLSKAGRLPTLDFVAGYGYNRQINEVGIVLESRNIGLNGGLTLAWNLFDGNRRNILIQSSEKQVYGSKITLDQAKLQNQRELMNAWNQYKNQTLIASMQNKVVETARLNFDRTSQLYRYGQVSSTGFREAQNNLMRAELTTLEARVNADLSALEIRRISGMLLTNP